MDVEIIELDDGLFEIKSPKYKNSFKIVKAPGTMFFEVNTGSVRAKMINGLFTSAEEAKREVLKYIRQAPKSKAKKRDETWERNHATRKIV